MLCHSPLQTSLFSPRSQQLSHFRNSAMTNLRSLFSSFLTNTKKIPAVSLTSDLCTHLTQTGNDQRAKMFGRRETKMRNPVVFYSHVYHSFKKKLGGTDLFDQLLPILLTDPKPIITSWCYIAHTDAFFFFSFFLIKMNNGFHCTHRSPPEQLNLLLCAAVLSCKSCQKT